jgi:hypothetical protein
MDVTKYLTLYERFILDIGKESGEFDLAFTISKMKPEIGSFFRRRM